MNQDKHEVQAALGSELKITKMSQIPTDPNAMTVNDIYEFLELVNSSRMEQIFHTQQDLWFMLQGKLVRHSMQPALAELRDLNTYLYCQKWYLRNEEEYQLWTQNNLEEKGWPLVSWFKTYLKAIESNKPRFGSSSKILQQEIQDQWRSVVVKYIDEEPPQYEHYCVNGEEWQRWLIAKENGWPSYEILLNKTYDLIDLDLFTENRSFCAEILNLLMAKPYNEVTNWRRAEFRKQIWLPFLFKTNTKNTFYQRRTQTTAHVIVEEIRTGDFEQFFLEEDIPMNKAQTILWFIAKQVGWTSYRELLDKAKTYVPIELWRDSLDERIRKGKDLDRYTDAIRSRLKFPYWKEVFERSEGIFRAILIVLASVNKTDLDNFNVEIDPDTGSCVFKVGSQQFEEFGWNQRHGW